jgi:hypothetical protein
MAAGTTRRLLLTLAREWIVLRALIAVGWCLVTLLMPTVSGAMLLIDRTSHLAWGIRALRLLRAHGQGSLPTATRQA